jgi:hypothetical protein
MDLHRHTNTNATSGQDPVTPYKHNDPWRCHGTLLRHPSFEFIVFNPSFELIMFNPHFLNSQFFQLYITALFIKMWNHIERFSVSHSSA